MERKYRRIDTTIEIKPTANIGLAIWRVSYFYETFVPGSTAVILLNFCVKNPPHRQAEKRCATAGWNAQKKEKNENKKLKN